MSQRIITGTALEYKGYIGESVILPCIGFASNEAAIPVHLEWRKCLKTCETPWPTAALAVIKGSRLTLERYTDRLTGNRSKVIPSSGNLQISELSKRDDGYYKCIWLNTTSMPLRLTLGKYA